MGALRTTTLAGVLLLPFCAQSIAAQGSAGPAGSAPRSPAAHPSSPSTLSGPSTSLGASLDALLRAPPVSGAHWGIAVLAMDGTPLYGLDEAKLFRPASTAKLFTTATAMALLGPESTVTTAIYGQLDAASGTVSGDLVLVGGGDPSFGTADLPYRPLASDANSSAATVGAALRDLTDQLVARGVRAVAGNVVGDGTLFGAEGVPEGWAEEDLVWGYGALSNALSIGDNEVGLIITPKSLPPQPAEAADIGATVQVDEVVPHLRVTSQVITAFADVSQPDRVEVYRSQEDPSFLVVNGSVTSGHPALHEHVALTDSALYAAQGLAGQLSLRGVTVDGVPSTYPSVHPPSGPFLAALRSPDPCGLGAVGVPVGCAYACTTTPHPTTMLASHTSPPLREEVAFTLKTSANLHAEVLLHRLGLKNTCAGATTPDGARTVRTWLLAAGLPDGDFVFYDGSGLSTKDLVTPRAEAQLLAYAAKQPWFPQWKAALPVGGVDGTLSTRFTSTPLKGHVFAKTGTLGESRALAGYVQCRSGREVVFAILDDNHQPGTSADRVVMDKIVEAIAANN